MEIESYIRGNFADYIILRLATVLGVQRGDGTLLTSWLDSIERGETSPCASDFVNSPVSVDDVVKSIDRLIQLGSTGTFHVASSKPVSRLELYRTLLGSIPADKIPGGSEPKECSIHDFDLPERRPNDVSMRPDKLINELGFRMTTVESICSSVVETAL